MVYGQDNLIPEKQLENFLNGLAYFWDTCGYSATRIAREMNFGLPEPEGYPNLKPHHVYYFVQRYGGDKYGMYPRRKLKKKKEETKQVQGIAYREDMPFQVEHYLRERGLLIE